MHKALTIAGSDSGAGAGIQADLKTFAALGVYGTSAITALTAQNTIGVQAVFPVDPEFVGQQIDSIMSDIGADAAKTGMLFSAPIIEVVAERVRRWNIEKLVVDPVMVAKSGDRLLQEEAIDALKRLILPLAYVVTPNLGEAQVVAGFEVATKPQMEQAARAIHALGAKIVVVKGGHLPDCADDVVYDGTAFHWLPAEHIDTPHTHGTGCTFSAAIAAFLAKGYAPLDAIARAKHYLTAALRAARPIGKGHSPVHHFHAYYPQEQ
ncbi:MAG: bifunctional hydroxymethylpyrimidine kinase/phosphomethylpyrimidine kinase [Armatimonadota bacterium]|nr:bifunctional hydroxymethylpyrimidine kinase/phosphomethylpyrimidine kinase [Armatimonadota bacterium]